MPGHQRNLFQRVAIWTGLAVFGVFLSFIITYSMGFLGMVAVVGGWMILCVVINIVARRFGWRTVAFWLAGVPFALLLSLNHTLPDLVSQLISGGGNPSVAVFFWALGLWSAICGLLYRSARGMYVALHLCNWFLWLGIASLLGWDSGPLLLIPLSVMLLLFGFSRPIIQKLVILVPFPHRWHSDTAPKSDDPRGYERGYSYQTGYQEGGNTYPMPSQDMHMPPISAPRAGKRQYK